MLARGKAFRLMGTQDCADAGMKKGEGVTCGMIGVYGGGGQCLLVVARYAFSANQATMLPDALPIVVHLTDAAENIALCWTLERTTDEQHNPQLGGVVIAHSLARMMFVQALRLHMKQSAETGVGGLSAVTDLRVSQAITAMQDDSAYNWTVEELARHVGMSCAALRSGFCAPA